METYKFPENFKWGSATSAHQIEGDNHNDWSVWENSPETIARLKREGKDPKNFISGKACDSYNRFAEDFDIAKKLNQNIHRFSIEWSRIEPEEGKFDSDAMQHYIQVVKALKERGIEPMITLWHFTCPIWFANKGGFLNKKSPEYFKKYVGYVAEHLKDQVGLWITFNEATTIYSSFSYLMGIWPPQVRNIFKWRRANRNIVRAHISAYKEIKRIYGDSPVGHTGKNHEEISILESEVGKGNTSHNVRVGITENNTYSLSGNKFYGKIAGRIYNYYRNLYLWYHAFPYYDFMGLNYYHVDRRVSGSYEILPRQEWWMQDKNWEIYPKGIYHVLMMLKKFKKPVYITENGTTGSDNIREKFIKEHLRWIWQAINDGVDVRGYMYWSLLDNFEINTGFESRFGLVEVDYKTFGRHIRPSAMEYAKICKENALNL
jgi:beta-glucosidase